MGFRDRIGSELADNLLQMLDPGFQPILAARFRTGAVTWYPKADEGNLPPEPDVPERWGIWGAAVRDYGRGYNHQPVQFLSAAIDVDKKDNETVADLPAKVAEALPEALVRTSSSGLGAHAFLVLNTPAMLANRAHALLAARKLAAPYAERLERLGIKPDIVANNMMWVTGGRQSTVQNGRTIIVPQGYWADLHVPGASKAVGTGECTTWAGLGSRCRLVLSALAGAGLIEDPETRVAAKYLVHIKPTQDALRELPWLRRFLTVESAGTRLHEPNAILSTTNGELRLFSFVGHRNVFALPLFV